MSAVHEVENEHQGTNYTKKQTRDGERLSTHCAMSVCMSDITMRVMMCFMLPCMCFVVPCMSGMSVVSVMSVMSVMRGRFLVVAVLFIMLMVAMSIIMFFVVSMHLYFLDVRRMIIVFATAHLNCRRCVIFLGTQGACGPYRERVVEGFV